MPPFAPGNPGGPGRPAGSWGGRRRAVAIVDDILSDASNLAKLRAALQARLDQDPVGFWIKIAVPLLPREAKLQLDAPDGAGIDIVAAVRDVIEAEQTGELPPDRERNMAAMIKILQDSGAICSG